MKLHQWGYMDVAFLSFVEFIVGDVCLVSG